MFDSNGCTLYIGVSNTTITNGQDQLIEVFIPELTPNALGTPDKVPSSEQVFVTDPFTNEKSGSTIPKPQTIKALFLGHQNGLVPCVHIGEQVHVVQFGGGETSYFWYPIGRDEGIRRHEHLRWYAMARSSSINKDSKSVNSVSDEESYFIDINTNPGEKIFHIHTSIVDGETTGYDIRIFPEMSRLEIVDTAGNELSLESENARWFMKNYHNSFTEINKDDITINCPGNILINGGKSVKITTPDYTNLGVKQTFQGTSSSTQMSSITENASAVSITGASMSLTGAIAVGGASFVVASGSGTVPDKTPFHGPNVW
jgi:uncharacterized Zn-binding protein involved in type VI secretion